MDARAAEQTAARVLGAVGWPVTSVEYLPPWQYRAIIAGYWAVGLSALAVVMATGVATIAARRAWGWL